MTSEKKIEANRKNALASTGPKSEKGKVHSKLNALKFGAHAKTRVLPFEDPAVYDEIARQVYEDVRPQGLLEETLADQIIYDFVILKRLEKAENAHLMGRAKFFAQDRAVKHQQYSGLNGVHYLNDEIYEEWMHNAKETKVGKQDIESALAASVGKDEGHIYERIDRRRTTLMRSILQKYRQIDEMRDRRLTLIDSISGGRTAA